ncbi:MAG: MBL fold metallo-hydrolase [Thermomicrobiales bacterium]|nr:MBL fold metallo-hydrolase [Thermomicrobiales bacterium]
MEIAPGIHRIDTPLGERRCSVYLLAGSDSALLIDTGLAGSVESAILPELDRLGVEPERVRLVLISHADIDHCGDAEAAKRAFPRALLACHHADAAEIGSLEAMIERRYGQFATEHGLVDSAETLAWYRAAGRFAEPDLLLAGGESFALGSGWTVDLLHVPGHSRGHLALWDPHSRAAIVIDAALGRTLPTRSGEPAFPPTYRDVDDYLTTLDRLAALEPELVLTAHYSTMDRTSGMVFLDESRGFVADAEAEVLDALGNSLSSTIEVLQRVGPALGAWPVDTVLAALAFPIVGHLERLEAVGRVRRRHDADGLAAWEAT